jgi:hypothetical protein
LSGLKLEAAASRRRQTLGFASSDGGLNYAALPTVDQEDARQAWKASVKVDGAELGLPQAWGGQAWLGQRQGGFSAPGQEALADTLSSGGELKGGLGSFGSLRLTASLLEQQGAARVADQSAAWSAGLGLGLSLTAEARHQDLEALNQALMSDTLGALRLDWQPNEALGLYA